MIQSWPGVIQASIVRPVVVALRQDVLLALRRFVDAVHAVNNEVVTTIQFVHTRRQPRLAGWGLINISMSPR